MKYQHLVAGAGGTVGIDATQRVMAGAGNMLARMLVGFPNIDQYCALAYKFGGAFGRNGLRVCHDVFPNFRWCYGQ